MRKRVPPELVVSMPLLPVSVRRLEHVYVHPQMEIYHARRRKNSSPESELRSSRSCYRTT
jgi:hypothetical protein